MQSTIEERLSLIDKQTDVFKTQLENLCTESNTPPIDFQDFFKRIDRITDGFAKTYKRLQSACDDAYDLVVQAEKGDEKDEVLKKYHAIRYHAFSMCEYYTEMDQKFIVLYENVKQEMQDMNRMVALSQENRAMH